MRRSQPRISGGREQSTAKSLLPGIRHQPPPLQKGLSGGRRCCCSTAAGNGRAMRPSAADPTSGHRRGGEGPLAGSAAWPGSVSRVSRPIAGEFLAFLPRLDALGESRCWGENQREGAAGPFPAAHLKCAHRRHHRHRRSVVPHHPFQLSQCRQAAAPRPRVQVLAPGRAAPGPGGRWLCLPCLGRPTSCRGVKLPRERREEDRKNNRKNLFHAAWIPPRTQQCFWTANL